MAKPKVHYNIRHVSVGKPVPYCHAVCESHEVSMQEHEVTCAVCCDFIDSFAVALRGRQEETREKGFSMVLGAAFLASIGAACYVAWKRFM
ncbi:MAG TPA: hypothetical protein VL426_02960 [Candidatus Binatia bacterium]|nr:hypothetical protein [Candidatus Binatia bacterium]